MDTILDHPSEHRTNDVILTISKPAAHYLRETSKWTHFLSILGFVFTGLIVILSLFIGSIFSNLPEFQNQPSGFSLGITIVYMSFALLYFFPTLYLYKFTQRLKSALASGDNNELILAFENQKSLYKFWGILSIVMLSIYALVFVVAFVVGALA